MKDAWEHLRQRTPARVALGRAGAGLPTKQVLAFAADHAAARDAIWTELDVDALAREVEGLPFPQPVLRLHSAAASRADYLRRPELGRRLAEEVAIPGSPKAVDLAITLADGLSAVATQRHAAPLLRLLIPELEGMTLAPLSLITLARVGIQDDIGARLRAQLSLILLGERPGLSSADSLGAYLVYNPGPGRTDADRNCVSNIRPAGLTLPAAAGTLAYLIRQALGLKISGIALKDERPASLPATNEKGKARRKENPRFGGGTQQT